MDERRQNPERREGQKVCYEMVCTALTELQGQVEGDFKVIDLRMQAVESGVKNFRNFQLGMTNKIGFVHGVAWVFTVLATIILMLFGWVLYEAFPAAKAIMVDYYAHHPEARVTHRSLLDPWEPVYTVRMNPSPDEALGKNPDQKQR
jgi:hypothetical protein